MSAQFRNYLGDGVYAEFDGYQIWLAANHRENKVIACSSSFSNTRSEPASCSPPKAASAGRADP